MSKPINQQTDAEVLMSELFDIGNMLIGTGVNIDPLTDLMSTVYTEHILKELCDNNNGQCVQQHSGEG